MRLVLGVVALLATLQCCCSGADAEGSTLVDAAIKKAVQESVGVPVSEFWKDFYGAVVRQKGARAARRLRYLLARLLGRDDALALARFLMDKLKEEVFQNRVNKETWDELTMELYSAIREWWRATPEHPRDAADLGAWQALVNLQKNSLGPSLRGSSRLNTINELLLEPDLETLRGWVSEWRGAAAAAPEEKPAEPAAAAAAAAAAPEKPKEE